MTRQEVRFQIVPLVVSLSPDYGGAAVMAGQLLLGALIAECSCDTC